VRGLWWVKRGGEVRGGLWWARRGGEESGLFFGRRAVLVGEDIDGEGHLVPTVGLVSVDLGDRVAEDKEFDLFVARGIFAAEEQADLIRIGPRDGATDPRAIGKAEIDRALVGLDPTFGLRTMGRSLGSKEGNWRVA
jgi:hypothetical protein